MQQVFARIFAVGVCLLFAACGTTTPLESQTKTQVASQGRIYFLRGNNYLGRGGAVEIKLNGQSVGNVANNSYFFVDRDAGAYKVTLEVPLTPGQYSLPVNVRAGSLTYIEVAPQTGNATAVLVGGLVGAAIAASASEDGKNATFRLALMDPAAGAALLQELKK